MQTETNKLIFHSHQRDSELMWVAVIWEYKSLQGQIGICFMSPTKSRPIKNLLNHVQSSPASLKPHLHKNVSHFISGYCLRACLPALPACLPACLFCGYGSLGMWGVQPWGWKQCFQKHNERERTVTHRVKGNSAGGECHDSNEHRTKTLLVCLLSTPNLWMMRGNVHSFSARKSECFEQNEPLTRQTNAKKRRGEILFCVTFQQVTTRQDLLMIWTVMSRLILVA